MPPGWSIQLLKATEPGLQQRRTEQKIRMCGGWDRLGHCGRKRGWEGGGVFWPNCPSLRLVLPSPWSQQGQTAQSSRSTSCLGIACQFRLKAIKFRCSHSGAQTSRDPAGFPRHLDIDRGNPFRALLTSSHEVQAPALHREWSPG